MTKMDDKLTNESMEETNLKANVEGGDELDHAQGAEMMKAERVLEEDRWSNIANLTHRIHEKEVKHGKGRLRKKRRTSSRV